MNDKIKNNNIESHDNDFSIKLNYTFTIGVYIAINAIADSYLLVDSPDCANMKILYIQGNHDLTSNLTSVSGFHRIANTAIHPKDVIASREDTLEKQLMQIANYGNANLVFITSMPMATIIGIDYDRIVKVVSKKTNKNVWHIPSKSLSGDWLDGYSETILAIAKGIKFNNIKKDPNKVAIVGYLMDRNEQDHKSNIKELKRILNGIGLKLVSTWLDGKNYKSLTKIQEAGLIISLPYAKKAAKLLAQKLDIPLIETDLPFGIENTIDWIKKISKFLSIENKVNTFIDTELEKIIPRLEWIINYVFLHKKVIFMGDPFIAKSFYTFSKEIGLTLEKVITICSRNNAKEITNLHSEQEIIVEPKMNTILKNIKKVFSDKNIHLFIGNSEGINLAQNQTPYMEFGFPSFFNHALFDKPFFGFSGAILFIEKMVNNMLRFEATKQNMMIQFKNGN